MTNEMKETLRQLDLFLKRKENQPNQKTIPANPEQSKPTSEDGLVEQICLIADFLSRTKSDKRCLLVKRSEIQSICKSQNMKFQKVEKLAESKMSETTREFYQECIKDK